MNVTITITCDKLPGGTTVAGFHGEEAISRLYEFSVFLVGAVDETVAAFDDLVDAGATLDVYDLDDTSAGHYRLEGMFAAVESLGYTGDSRPVLCATLVPHLWGMTQNRHSRVFTDDSKTIPDIVEDLLKASDVAYNLAKAGSYGQRDFVCQYRESNFAFISRWMEREGLYYFFDHDNATTEKLLIVDDKSLEGDSSSPPTVSYNASLPSTGECLRSFRRRSQRLPGRVNLTDHDYQKPEHALAGASGDPGAVGELNEYGLGFSSEDDGNRLAKIQLEQVQCRRVVCRAEGTTRRLHAGYRFHLDGYQADASLEVDYLATRLEHFGLQQGLPAEVTALIGFSQPDVYRVEVEAILAGGANFRAAAVTRWPRISGFQNAVIDGPSDDTDYAQIDEHGRYKVKFKFDESGLEGGKASAWVRRLQPLAGSPEGFHFPLRKGTEVLVTFLGGDPDQPVIAGAVPSAVRPSPVATNNKSEHRIVTAAQNEFLMVDDTDNQTVKLSTPYNDTRVVLGKEADSFEIHTDGDGELYFGGELKKTTGKDKNEEIHGDFHETVYGHKGEAVLGYEDREVAGLKTETIGGGEVKYVIGEASDTVIGDELKLVVGAETKTVVGLAPIASQVNLIGGENKNILGAGATNVLGADFKFVGGGVQDTIVGVENKNVLGGKVEFVGGAAAAIIVGAETKAVLGGVSEFVLPLDYKVVVGEEMKFVLGAVIDMVIGAKVDIVVGAKVDAVMGATFSDEETRIKEMEADIKSAETKIKLLSNWIAQADAVVFP